VRPHSAPLTSDLAFDKHGRRRGSMGSRAGPVGVGERDRFCDCFMPQTCPKGASGCGGLTVEQTIATGGVAAGLLLVRTFCWCWRLRCRRKNALAVLDKLGSWEGTQLGRGPRPPRTRPPSTLGTMAGAGAAVDPTPAQFRRKWGTDRHHLPTRHPEPGSSRVGGQTRRPRAPGQGYPARPGQNLMVRATASPG
jgi:hypothetical protein